MTEFLQITTTTSTRQDAEQLPPNWFHDAWPVAQVSGPIVSTFRWQGKTETAEEWMCTAKTSRDQLTGIQELLNRIHRYEVPELIATPIVGGSEAYLKWLAEQLGS